MEMNVFSIAFSEFIQIAFSHTTDENGMMDKYLLSKDYQRTLIKDLTFLSLHVFVQ